MKKTISFVLVVCMIMALLPTSVFAEGMATDGVIEISSLTELKTIITNAESDLNLKLTKNFSDTGSLSIPNYHFKITIDLNGNTLTKEVGLLNYVIENRGTGLLTIKNGTITAAPAGGATIFNSSTGTLIIDNVIVENTNPTSSRAISNEQMGTIVISNSKVTTLEGYAVNNNSGKIEIINSELKTTGNGDAAISNKTGTIDFLGGVSVISGPTAVSEILNTTTLTDAKIYGSTEDIDGTDATEITASTIETKAGIAPYKYLKFVFPTVKNETTTAVYYSLQEAIDDVQSGNTLKLLNDITQTTTIETPSGTNKDFTIDLNGKTIITEDCVFLTHKNYGTLTIKDSDPQKKGRVTNNIKNDLITIIGGNLNIQGGSFYSKSYVINHQSRYSIVISGGKIESDNYAINMTIDGKLTIRDDAEIYGKNKAINIISMKNIFIEGGIIRSSSGDATIGMDSRNTMKESSLQISGGKIINEGSGQAIYTGNAYSGHLIIKNSSDKTPEIISSNANRTVGMVLGTMTLSGGIIRNNGNGYAISTLNMHCTVIAGPCVLSAKNNATANPNPNFAENINVVASYYPDGRESSSYDDSKFNKYRYLEFTVNPSPTSTAKIGANEYASLQAALDAVKGGQTIEIQRDLFLPSPATIKNAYDFTIDLKGHLVSHHGEGVIVHSGSGTLSIQDTQGEGRFTNNSQFMQNSTILLNSGNLNIISGTIERIQETIPTSNLSGIKNIGNGNITVLGGTITSSGYGIYSYNEKTPHQSSVTIDGGNLSTSNNQALYCKQIANVTVKNATIQSASATGIEIIDCENTLLSNVDVYSKYDNGIKYTNNKNTGTFVIEGNSTISNSASYVASLYISSNSTTPIQIKGGVIKPTKESNTYSAINIYGNANVNFSENVLIQNNSGSYPTIAVYNGTIARTITLGGATIENSSTGNAITVNSNVNLQIIGGPTVLKSNGMTTNKAPDYSEYSNVKIKAATDINGNSVMEYDENSVSAYKHLAFTNNTDTTITNLNLTNKLTAPTLGATPSTNFIGNSQYSGTVSWEGNPEKFSAEQAYTAKVTLTAKEGYTFAGLIANQFQHSDATSVTHHNGTGDVLVVTITFPEIPKVPITGAITIDNVNPRIGDTLTATVTGSNASGTGTYIWRKNLVEIGRGPTYIVKTADLGQEISVDYTSSDNTGSLYTTTNAVLKKINAQTPSKPEIIAVTTNSVTLKNISGYEYSIDGDTWTDAFEFTGLNPYTNYTFYQRAAETEDAEASAKSEGIIVKTLCSHSWDEGVVTTEPTTTSKGVMTFTCIICGETYTEDIDMLPPSIVDSENNVWKPSDPTPPSFRSNAALVDFIRVLLNGEELDEQYYEVTEGSIIVTLKADYLKTLKPGTYTLGIESVGGVAETEFTVQSNSNVPTTPTTPSEPSDPSDTPTPSEPSDNTTPPTPTDTTKPTVPSKNPQTGDTTLPLFALLLVITGALVTRKRKTSI